MTPFGVVPRWRPYVPNEKMPPGMLFRKVSEPETVWLVGNVNRAGGACGHCEAAWPYTGGPSAEPLFEVSSVLLDHGLRVSQFDDF